MWTGKKGRVPGDRQGKKAGFHKPPKTKDHARRRPGGGEPGRNQQTKNDRKKIPLQSKHTEHSPFGEMNGGERPG